MRVGPGRPTLRRTLTRTGYLTESLH